MRRGHGHVAGSLHGGERHIPLAGQLHLPVQAVGGFIHEFVEAGNGIVERQHHEVGRPLLLHENVEVKILLAADGLRGIERPHLHGHRDHVRPRSQHAHDAAMAVLVERAHDVGGVGELVGLVRRGERHQHLALAHGHIDRAEVEERVPEGQHALAVVVGHGSQAGDAHVAIHQHARHGFSGVQRMLPSGRGLVGMERRARASALRRGDAKLLEHGAEFAQCALGETREDQRRLDGNHHGRSSCPPPRRCPSNSPGTDTSRPRAWSFIGRARILRPGVVEIVDLQHQLDGRDAADGVRREHAEPQRHRADQFPVDIHRAAAHAARHVGAGGLASQFGQDDILPRSPGVLPQADDLHGNRLGFRALKDGPGGALHAGLDFAQPHDFDLAGHGARERRIRRVNGQRNGREAEQDRGIPYVHGVNSSSWSYCTMLTRRSAVDSGAQSRAPCRRGKVPDCDQISVTTSSFSPSS